MNTPLVDGLERGILATREAVQFYARPAAEITVWLLIVSIALVSIKPLSRMIILDYWTRQNRRGKIAGLAALVLMFVLFLVSLARH